MRGPNEFDEWCCKVCFGQREKSSKGCLATEQARAACATLHTPPSLPYPPLYRRQHKISLQFRTQFVGPRTRAMSPRSAVERSSASVRMSVCPHVRMSISVWLCVGSHQLKAITMSAAATATGCPSKLKALFVAALFPSLSARQRRKHACNCNLLFRLSLALSPPPLSLPPSRSSLLPLLMLCVRFSAKSVATHLEN